MSTAKRKCFFRLLKLEGIVFLSNYHQATNSVLNNIADRLEALDLFNSIQVDEFLEIAKEKIVYKVSSNDQIITELVETFRTNNLLITNLKDIDNSFEISV
ncbi:23621_t:CDS:2, partial [Dentiscutata erythropus]